MPKRQKETLRRKSAFDVTIYFIAIAGPLMTLPQFFMVWFHGDTSGVSVLTWLAYAVISFFWVLYGVKHEQKPIILTNGLLLSIDALIVVGVLLK